MCPPMPVAQVLTLFINHVQDDFILNNGNKYFKYNDAKRHFFTKNVKFSIKKLTKILGYIEIVLK